MKNEERKNIFNRRSNDLVHRIIHGCADDFLDLNFSKIQAIIARLENKNKDFERENQMLKKEKIRLTEGRNKLDDFFNDSPLGYFIVGQDGCVKDANTTGCAIIGMDGLNQVKRQPFHNFLSESSVTTFCQHLRNVCRHLKRQVCEVRTFARHGLERDLELRIDGWMESRHRVFCRIIATDTTNRIKAENSARTAMEILTNILCRDPVFAEKYRQELKELTENSHGSKSLEQIRVKLAGFLLEKGNS